MMEISSICPCTEGQNAKKSESHKNILILNSPSWNQKVSVTLGVRQVKVNDERNDLNMMLINQVAR